MNETIRPKGLNKERHAERLRAYEMCYKYNTLCPTHEAEQQALLGKMLHKIGKSVRIKPPFYCDYGYNIEIGNECEINYNCVMLDDNKITIGNNVRIAPNVGFYTVYHPLDPTERKNGVILSKPITICDNVWIGGGAIILAGVTIGANVVVGAGAIVTKDVPSNVVVVGNPAHILKEIKDD